MRSIQIRLQSSDRFSEFLGDDVDQAELMIENIVAEALLQFFDTVLVEGVTVRHVAEQSDADVVKSSIECENV
jgi:hypothetical protein